MKKRVGVNLTWLVPGQVGGSEEHILSLLRSYSEVPNLPYSVRLYAQKSLEEHHPDLSQRFEICSLPASSPSKGLRILSENSWLAYVSRQDAAMHHAGGVVPFVRSAVPLVTIHDIQPIDLPENFSSPKRQWLQKMIPHSVTSSRYILCPSSFTADRIRSLYQVSPERLQVISSVGDILKDHSSAEKEEDTFDISARFGKFILYPAITYTHKRHKDIVDALQLLGDKAANLSLVCTGRPGPLSEELDRYANTFGLGHRVHQLGRVPREELEALYRRAVALVFPSAYEGFGNPLLEAMKYGCPVISSDAGALPEVAGDAALMYPVRNIEALAGNLQKIQEPETSEALRQRGYSRAAWYGSQNPGKVLAEVYAKALAQYKRIDRTGDNK